MARPRLPMPARFMAMVRKTKRCWFWTGYVNHDGYGKFRIDGKSAFAHVVSYEQFVGVVPEGLELDHLCGVRACVNPKHLEPVTHGDNIRRWAVKTHCIRGHRLAGKNLYHSPSGRRECYKCRRLREQRRWGGSVG